MVLHHADTCRYNLRFAQCVTQHGHIVRSVLGSEYRQYRVISIKIPGAFNRFELSEVKSVIRVDNI